MSRGSPARPSTWLVSRGPRQPVTDRRASRSTWLASTCSPSTCRTSTGLRSTWLASTSPPVALIDELTIDLAHVDLARVDDLAIHVAHVAVDQPHIDGLAVDAAYDRSASHGRARASPMWAVDAARSPPSSMWHTADLTPCHPALPPSS